MRSVIAAYKKEHIETSGKMVSAVHHACVCAYICTRYIRSRHYLRNEANICSYGRTVFTNCILRDVQCCTEVVAVFTSLIVYLETYSAVLKLLLYLHH